MKKQTPTIAILAIVFAFLIPIVGLILSIIALVQIKKDPNPDAKTLAIVALVVSIVYTILTLIIIAMIGSLLFIGILAPSKLLPDRCMFGSAFVCEDFDFSADTNTGYVILSNNVNKDLIIYEVESTQCTTARVDNNELKQGGTVRIDISDCKPTTGKIFRDGIHIMYNDKDMDFGNSVIGEIVVMKE